MPNFQSSNYDLFDRSLVFAADVAKMVNNLPTNKVLEEYSKQLIRSSASIGANLQEADGALTKRDFVHKLGIARKEAKESWFWLRLIKQTGFVTDKLQLVKIDALIQEAKELKLILSSIIQKIQNKSK